jgi:HNH endonuclease/AP2 domain
MTKFKPIPPVEFLKSRYSYDPVTGVLVSKFGRWKSQVVMQTEQQGYVVVRIDKKIFKAHRVIWKMMTGQEPPDEIDHVNNDRADNRWSNLRDATKANNQWNRKAQRSGRAGLKGAQWHERDQRWYSEIRTHGDRVWLGYFETPEEAHDAYVKAARLLHGQFAK